MALGAMGRPGRLLNEKAISHTIKFAPGITRFNPIGNFNLLYSSVKFLLSTAGQT